MRLHFLAAMIGALLMAAPVQAETTVPSPLLQEILINHPRAHAATIANVTANYTVLHAKLAKPFRQQFTPDRLKQVFKAFVEQKADWGLIATKAPIATSEATIDKRGVLMLRGYLDTKPSRLIYELDFIPSEGEWKPMNLNVNAKHAERRLSVSVARLFQRKRGKKKKGVPCRNLPFPAEANV